MDKLKAQRIVNKEGWIGVDLDGTLATFPEVYTEHQIGDPIMPMVERVKGWLNDGREVKIFTARAWDSGCIQPIQDWLETVGLPRLDVTNIKEPQCIEIWDDRAVQVVFNIGKPVGTNYIK